MTTYEQGKAPPDAPYTYDRDAFGFVAYIYRDGVSDDELSHQIELPRVADRVCRAFYVAKCAEDYVRACDRSDELRESDPFIETAEGRARAEAVDAAHDALLKAVRS